MIMQKKIRCEFFLGRVAFQYFQFNLSMFQSTPDFNKTVPRALQKIDPGLRKKKSPSSQVAAAKTPQADGFTVLVDLWGKMATMDWLLLLSKLFLVDIQLYLYLKVLFHLFGTIE